MAMCICYYLLFLYEPLMDKLSEFFALLGITMPIQQQDICVQTEENNLKWKMFGIYSLIIRSKIIFLIFINVIAVKTSQDGKDGQDWVLVLICFISSSIHSNWILFSNFMLYNQILLSFTFEKRIEFHWINDEIKQI